jgi:uncharacterized protein YyaL (SSP411 family)
VTVRNLIRLSQLDGDQAWLARAARTLERYGSTLGQVVRVMPLMAANLALWHGRRTEVVLVGEPATPDLIALERVVGERYLPWAVTVTLDATAGALRLPWLKAMTMREGLAAAYVCHEFTCAAPTTDATTLAAQLDAASAPRRIILA